ncbi:isocitrate lyase/phosphoenolpyruvate mutase family protein [Caenimonas sedimenti]|uniref:Isocitrate lyase/phosphoenolpyruvate mutase family protein n=1 Tax=Caenimonas sedimenti TaxID=2596921 RepID=A0A562ZW13_9BURK|nr:isocitrate lyase/phosphoenolpyruvate mutase family protein [Caenimonas sedimenti]TWO72770.1 isocitrate lyase/phosphoenolpyruvate mutase family protein [Caenimonas sedimenti]
MKTQQAKAQRFEQLHAGTQCFLIPNPWDTGSARLLEHMGFEALASTSAGFAFSRGKPDMSVTREEKMLHLRELCAATNLPVSADLENGYGHKPEDAAETIRQAALAGVVGGSIEDSTGDAANPIYDIDAATDRIRAAVAAARSTGFKFMLTARAENHLWGRNDLPDTIRRLQAYQEAGADVLFAPGLKTLEDIRTVLAAIDRPLNVIMGSVPLTLAQLQEAGVRRLSVGGSLARVAYGSMMAAARKMLEQGDFAFAKDMPPHKVFNDIFKG